MPLGSKGLHRLNVVGPLPWDDHSSSEVVLDKEIEQDNVSTLSYPSKKVVSTVNDALSTNNST